jgi:hypothetical protein
VTSHLLPCVYESRVRQHVCVCVCVCLGVFSPPCLVGRNQAASEQLALETAAVNAYGVLRRGWREIENEGGKSSATMDCRATPLPLRRKHKAQSSGRCCLSPPFSTTHQTVGQSGFVHRTQTSEIEELARAVVVAVCLSGWCPRTTSNNYM